MVYTLSLSLSLSFVDVLGIIGFYARILFDTLLETIILSLLILVMLYTRSAHRSSLYMLNAIYAQCYIHSTLYTLNPTYTQRSN